ncbi:chitobiase/beta-hexosaminidase C-terminal domain-containing protein [Bacillus cytotoxicus]|uniref:Chitobiase/beta-hexosaminidase C-terminal domain-containing protein n=1 Tax=Bacillus cytotoxicus TaxID=580165 RepID=A0ACC6A985_9BACI|nr:chitobiase/beta-hexosaminidase C-terminal domain-containing protein [Bacillus cytotoxicus]
MANSIFKTYEVTLDTMIDTDSLKVIKYSQNDLNSAKLIINIQHNGQEFNLSSATSIRISFEKEDGKLVYQDCQPINVLSGKYQVLLNTQTLVVIGKVRFQIHIEFPNQKIDTQKFFFVVDKSFMSDQTIKSTNVMPLIEQAIEAGKKLEGVDIQKIVDATKTAEDAKKKSEENAVKIVDLQQDVDFLKKNGTGGGSGILSFQTLADLQKTFPNGTDKPVWIISENSWYYWWESNDNTPPNNVTNLTASNITGTTVTLSWAASSSNDTVGYDVFKGTTFITTVTGTSYNIGGLSNNTSYTFWVKAKDAAGNIASGTSVNVTTTNTIPTDTTPPIVSANPSGGTFTSTQSVVLSVNETATIYYTTNGTTPTTSSPIYNAPIIVSTNMMIKFFAKDTAGNSSVVQTAAYTINETPSNPGDVLFYDTFNRADSTSLGASDSGHTWTDYKSINGTITLGIRGGMAYMSGGTWASAATKFRRFTTVPITTNNFVLEVQTKSLPQGSGDSLGICIRMPVIDGDMIYLLKPAISVPSGKYSLAKIPYGNNVNTIGQSTSLAGEDDLVRIEHRSDGSIKVYINDVLEISANETLALNTNTRVGIGINADIAGLGIDSFKVTSI